MEHKKTPIALPVKIGMGEHRFNANVLTDSNDDSIATTYGIPQSTSLEELRNIAVDRPEMWADGMAKAEYMVRAINSHDALVAALREIAKPIEGKPIGDPWGFYADLQKIASDALATIGD